MDAVLDATHYSFYIDEDDESIIINEEKLKTSGLPFIRRYRTKSLNDSSANSSTLGEKRLNCSADSSSSEDKSAGALGLSADECIVGLNALQLSDASNDKENKAPSEQIATSSSKECLLALSSENNVDAGAECLLDGEILAQYLEPLENSPLASQEMQGFPSDKNAIEELADDGYGAVVLSAPVAMSTPRPSRTALQSIAETGADSTQQPPDSRSNSERKPSEEYDCQFCDLDYMQMPRLVEKQKVFSCSENTDAVEPGHVGDDFPHSGNRSEPSPCPMPVETSANLVEHIPSEIQGCGSSPASSHSRAEERFQNLASTTTQQHHCVSVVTLTPTKVSSAGHSGKTLADHTREEECNQDCTTSSVASSATESNCFPVVRSGVEMACQTSFRISSAGEKSTACVTPTRQLRRLTHCKSPQKGAGSAPAKPICRRKDSGVPGTFQIRSRTLSNTPVRGWCPATTPLKPRVFKVPTPVTKNTPSKIAVKTPAKTEQRQSLMGSTQSAGKLVRSPWSVVSPVARYIHEKPAPHLIQIVRARKSPSTKTLSAATSPALAPSSTGSPKVCAAALPDKRYHSSNIGILHKAGLDPLVKLAKPIVIKHTVPSELGDQSAAEMEASVIQVIRQ